ncbi:MAG: glycosyltransferase family 2 protein [Halodesulfurarchaeum sp.]
MTVGVVIPAYNEAGKVGNVIEGIPSFVDRAYVIDDGSTDSTWAEIRAHAEARNESHDGRFEDLVVPIEHETNRGVGGAIKTGYLRAREEQIDATAVLGGDDQMDGMELPKYLDPIADGVADYVKGNRFDRPEHWATMPRFRLVGNVILSYLTKIASGYWETMDSQNGYTAISLRALEEADIEGMYEYYGYCNDLLVRLNAANIRVADVPRSSDYAYAEGWDSHIDYKEYIPRVSVMLLRGFLWRLRRKYLLSSFDPLAVFYVLGMAILAVAPIGLLHSLLRPSKDGPGTWLLGIVSGAVIFLHGASLDREDNSHLEVRIEPESADGGSKGTESGPIEGDVPEWNEKAETDEDIGSEAQVHQTNDRG